MLIIVMHNRQKYLEHLLLIAKKEGIPDATIIEKKGIGCFLIGTREDVIYHKGEFRSEYDRAFISVTKNKERAKHLLDLIENDALLKLLNVKDKGFICIVPFQQIRVWA